MGSRLFFHIQTTFLLSQPIELAWPTMAIDNSNGVHQASGGSHEPKRSTLNTDNEERGSRDGFAEFCSNPPPELVLDQDHLPEPVTHGGDDDSNGSTHPVVQPDVGDRRGPAVVYAEPDRSWIAKHKTWVIVGLILAIIVMVGVTVGVVLVERAHNGPGIEGGGATR